MTYLFVNIHLSVVSYRRLRESLELFGPRKQNWTIESAGPILAEARKRHPTAGIQEMINIVRTENQCGLRIPR